MDIKERVNEIASLPSWECGLKSLTGALGGIGVAVTPFVGVWIEINIETYISAPSNVTPFVGVWIEIGLIPS